MINLLKETLEILDSHEKTPDDVEWIGGIAEDGFWFNWDDFAAVAKDTNYDNGFGGQEVAKDLVIAGNGWWLERDEYDGAEDWAFKAMPPRPEISRLPKNLSTGGLWNTLAEMNSEAE